jgi:hypothetical protein
MDPELASRLRRYGEQVEHAAIAAQAGRPTPRATADGDDTDELPTVVPITVARSNRRFQVITAAAAAAIVVVAGALVTWRMTGDSDPRPADSTQVTVNTTAEPSTTSTATTTTTATTTLPLFPGGGSSSTTSSTTTTTTGAPSTSSAVNAPPTTVACPNYDAYGTRYPIRLCHTGPAVRLIQERVGAPEVDGLFGPATRQSVRVFQQVHDLEVDGLVGPATWAAMFPAGASGTDADGDGTVEPWEVG